MLTRRQGWGSAFYDEGLSIHSATKEPVCQLNFEYTCHENHVNKLGNLHGGCVATLFDYCTSCALIPISEPGFWQLLGVSRTLNCTYIRPVRIGERVTIECVVINAGKRLCKLQYTFVRISLTDIDIATITGVMKRKSDGAIMAMCEHGKVNVDAKL